MGEDFAEKNDALRQLGIESRFPTKDSVPDVSRHRLLPKLRAEGSDPVSSMFALSLEESNLPDKQGPFGWTATLWRERQLLLKEHRKALDGRAPLPQLSTMGNAMRTAGDQMLIENTGAQTPGDLADARQFPEHVYDNGKPKPASEIAFPVSPSAELVWQQEQRDELSPFRTNDELEDLATEATYRHVEKAEADEKIHRAIDALKNKRELETTIVSSHKGKSKYDYLMQWREMYQQGTLEVPDEAVLRFGRSTTDHRDTLAATIRAWYAKNKKSAPTEEQLEKRKTAQAIGRERAAANAVNGKVSRTRRQQRL